MDLNIYAVYDAAAEAYLPPFFQPKDGQALRLFKASINDPDHAFGMNPSDYTLFCLGYFEDNTAGIFPYGSPRKLANGVEALDYPNELREVSN